jgi:hypothetical protein
MEVTDLILKRDYPTQKDYALAVQSHCKNKLLHSFFFSNKAEILNRESVSELYTVWIKAYYGRFMDLWKDID